METVDPYFAVKLIEKTANPQQAMWRALHQDYAEGFALDDTAPSEKKAGEIIVKQLLAGNRGHYGPLEHVQIILNCGWFPHSTIVQLRTHRTGVSFDVQSQRYTSKRVIDVAKLDRKVDEVFYLRPVGTYTDRQGSRYAYTEEMQAEDREDCRNAAIKYAYRVEEMGVTEEHARDLLPQGIRQHFVMSANLRSLLHILLIRGKKDAQLEVQHLCELTLPHLKEWVPQVYDWFEANLWLKGRLAP